MMAAAVLAIGPDSAAELLALSVGRLLCLTSTTGQLALPKIFFERS